MGVLIIINGACKTISVIQEPYEGVNTEEKISLIQKTNFRQIDRLWIKKFSGEIQTEDMHKKFKGNMRLVKDSLLIISINAAMGMEGIRIYLSGDSLIVLNRMGSNYYRDRVEEARIELSTFLNLALIQNILLANAGMLTDTIWKKIKRGRLSDQNYCIEPIQHKVDLKALKGTTLLKKACFDENTLMASCLLYENRRNETKISIKYSDFIKVNDSWFAGNLNFVAGRGEVVIFSFKVEMGRLDVSSIFPTSIRLGSRYKRVRRLSEL